MTAKTTNRKPRPTPAAKKPATKTKTTPTTPAKADAPSSFPAKETPAPTEVSETPAVEAPEKPAPAASTNKPKRRKISPQPPSLVRAVVASNELLLRLCSIIPDAKELEVSTTLEDAVAVTKEDPVALESAFQLLQGLGLGNFVFGRRNTVTRFVWFVGNIVDIVKGTAEEYAAPKKRIIQRNVKIRYGLSLLVSAEQREALSRDLGMEYLSRDDIKKWSEETIYGTLNMLVDASKEAAK